jgi:hypothetical protein
VYVEQNNIKKIVGFVLILWLISNIFGFSIRSVSPEETKPTEINTELEISEKSSNQTPTNETTSTINNSEPLPTNYYSEIYEYDISTLLSNISNLEIDNSSIFVVGYDRDEFGGWIDLDNDCQNTRAEILIDNSEEEVFFRSSNNCVVDSGYWYDPYTDSYYYLAKEVQIDHFVPLKNAYISGAHQWSEDRKKEYSTYTLYEYHLIPVYGPSNQKKGAKGPEDWLPENTDFHCAYINIWVEIKLFWELTVTQEEFDAIEAVSKNC